MPVGIVVDESINNNRYQDVVQISPGDADHRGQDGFNFDAENQQYYGSPVFLQDGQVNNQNNQNTY